MAKTFHKPPDELLGISYDYIPDERLVTVVNIAIRLGRPLLVKGPPGCGKTRLAAAIAAQLEVPLYSWYVKSTSRAQDGLYSIDVVRRLQDAQMKNPKAQTLTSYLRFGVLGEAIRRGRRCVVLIDEIDKADIDFPNDLLREIEELRFTVEEIEDQSLSSEERREGYRRDYSTDEPPIIIITSNDEKELPDAFLRRCIFHYIDFPPAQQLEKIVHVHLNGANVEMALISQAVELLGRFREVQGLRKLPATSELIDWVRILSSWGVKAEALTSESALTDAPYWEMLFKYREDHTAIRKASHGNRA